MSLDRPFTGDPLLMSIKLMLESLIDRDWGPVLNRLTEDIEHMRQRTTAGQQIHREDPVKVAINRILNAERIIFEWDKLVILGCSAGGDVALRQLFEHISYPHLPIIIAMHHGPKFKFMAGFKLANGLFQLPTVVQTDMAIKSGEVYFVPGDHTLGYHLTNNAFSLSPVNGNTRFRPVIDQVFATTGIRFGNQVGGAILSGMLYDGAKGLKDIFLNHGEVVIQAPATAMFAHMPQSAMSMVPTARVLSPQLMAAWINNLTRDHIRARSYRPAPVLA